MEKWFPIGAWLPKYKWGEWLVPDFIAAITVAALLIPESMGYASVAGLPVEIGLYAAPLALIGYALFGGSRLLVVATVGAVAAITGSLLMQFNVTTPETAIAAAAALAMTAGVVFIVAGLLKMGWLTNFLSRAVLEGFVLGMAIQIIIGQLDELTGVSVEGESAFAKFLNWIGRIGEWNMTATLIGAAALLLIFGLARYRPKAPGAIIAVVLGSVVVAVFNPDIELVAKIPTGLPAFADFSAFAAQDWLLLLLGGALVALISFSEGWGASADLSRRTHDRLNSNQEFIAYGVSNLGAGLLGGMPVGGSLSKSSAGVSAGAKSQMSNIFLAVLVLLTLLFFAPLFQWLPEAVLAAIVIHAMSHSASPHKIRETWEVDRIDAGLGALTALLVLTFDLLPAMIAGIVLSVGLMIYRTSFPARAELGRETETGDFVALRWLYGRREGRPHTEVVPLPGTIIYRFSAPLIFSNAEAFLQSGQNLLIEAGQKGALPRCMIVDFESVFYVDTTGADALANLVDYLHRYGVELKLARVHGAAYTLLEKAAVLDLIGVDNVYDTVHAAAEAAQEPPAG